MQLIFGDHASLFEVHQVQIHSVVLQGKCREERLVWACCRYFIHFVLLVTLVLVLELYHVGRLGSRLLQVPDLELFLFVDGEEFAHSTGKPLAVVDAGHCLFALDLLEVELAPFYLSNWTFALLVPHSQRGCKAFVVQAE